MLIAISLISIFISIPGLLLKAGYSFKKSIIPVYNIYLLFKTISFPAIFLMLVGICLIFFPFRMFALTLLIIVLPFVITEAYDSGKVYGFLCLILPFVFYPYLAYIKGVYAYDDLTKGKNYILTNKIFFIILFLISFYVYDNYTRLVSSNSLIDKKNIHYVNDLYMSDARIYNEYLNPYEKKMYLLLFEKSKSYDTKINIKMQEYGAYDYNSLSATILKAHDAILADHPELINYSGVSWKYSDNDISLTLDLATKSSIKSYFGNVKIKRIIEKIKNDTSEMSDIEKIKYVYDWMGENNTYDTVFTTFSKNQSIYNVFIKNNAVCAGFAKASTVIFQNIGIKAYTITGYSTGPHMWNIVELDGKWYFFDSTIATCVTKDSENYYNGLKQEYMNFYKIDHKEWYPEIEIVNGLYK